MIGGAAVSEPVLASARALLAEAGYPDGFSMTLSYPTGGSGNMVPGPMNTALQADLAKIGVKVKLEPIEWAALFSDYFAGKIPDNANAINISLSYQQEALWSLWFASDSTVNAGKYSNSEVDRLLAKVGLHGKSFIPMLSSFACAIPGIMATRAIADPKDRLTTILIAPLMTCSARLPVYALLIAAFIPARQVGGLFNLQGIVLFALLPSWGMSNAAATFQAKLAGDASTLPVDSSTSAKTTFAPRMEAPDAVATNVIGVVMTSSPAPTPAAA